ncbi:MAG: DUF2799 domain-containing protein [Roseinatronobacter sp.]
MIRRAFLVLLLLGACASVSREECESGDWAAIGQRDGATGRVAEVQFERHQRACARVDVTPDRMAWQAGYAQGLRQFCTPLSGLAEGEAGRSYRGVCPAEREAGFLRGHELGLAAFRQRSRIADLRRDLSRANRVRVDGDGRLIGADLSEALFLRLEISQAEAELAQIQREIRAFRAAQ